MQDIDRLERDLWEAADQLRANSKLTAGEYSMPVLGLIFLRYATNRFYLVKEEIEASLPSRGGVKPPLQAKMFEGRAAIFLPEEAQYDYLAALPETVDIGEKLVTAMKLIEAQSTMLKDVLPKEYTRFEPRLLRQLLRIFDQDALHQATGDVIGRIYEYFLNKFAMSGAQEGGEFFTPPSMVRLIVMVIEPTRGLLLDPAVGSAGMFVQTGYFLSAQGTRPAERMTFFGQEKSDTNTRLARMNMAVHGLEGEIVQGNTFYDFLVDKVGKCSYVMTNPPFNVDGVDPDRIKNDPRLPFKIPGISSKTKAVSNANYLWIQYFYSYLNETGRAGFVMASSATDAGHGEKRIREELIATGDVDVILAMGTNFFYTRSLPCTLWFFDRGKPETRKDQVLMIDARHIYRVVTRKIRDFSDEQLQNLTAIVWLYRGETDRYLGLVQGYLAAGHAAAATVAGALGGLDGPVAGLTKALRQFAEQVEPAATNGDGNGGRSAAEIESLRALLDEQATATAAFAEEREALAAALRTQLAWYAAAGAQLTSNEGQRACQARVEPLQGRLRSVQRHVAEVTKLTGRALDLAEKNLGARSDESWDNKSVRQLSDALEVQRLAAVEAIRETLYQFQQVHWLQSKFPDGVYTDVAGLCKVVSRAEIKAHDSSLTPGRYVEVAPQELEDDDVFEERIQEIHMELSGLNEEAMELALTIQSNFEALSI